MIDAKTLELLKDESIAIELRTLLLQHELEAERARRDRENTQWQRGEDARLKRLEFWHNTPLVVALVGVITIAANGAVSWIQSDQTADAAASQTERQFSYEVITSELSKTSDQKERANVLLFLTEVGVLDDLDREALTRIALNSGGTEGATIPPSIGAFTAPSYDLPVPDDVVGQTAAANALLKIAVEELNRDVDEFNQVETIQKYWSVIPEREAWGDDIGGVPWSAVFLSWAVNATGNPDGLELSTLHYKMWDSAVSKGMTIGSSAPLPGDIVFIASGLTVGGPNSNSWTGISGIVHSVTEDRLIFIGGNASDGLRLVNRPRMDSKLIGFVRLGTSGTN